MGERPYSPETLADRWGCSAEKVRRMYHGGELAGFRLGKLIRIPANEVERVECKITLSDGIAENRPSNTSTEQDAAFGARLVRLTGGSQRLELVTTGPPSPPRRQNG